MFSFVMSHVLSRGTSRDHFVWCLSICLSLFGFQNLLVVTLFVAPV